MISIFFHLKPKNFISLKIHVRNDLLEKSKILNLSFLRYIEIKILNGKRKARQIFTLKNSRI